MFILLICNLYSASYIYIHISLDCGDWVQSNANTLGEVQVGYVSSKEECLSLYFSDPRCYAAGASMANVDMSDGYDRSTRITHYGSCWCQFGNTMEVDDDRCCITTWAKDCRGTHMRKISY